MSERIVALVLAGGQGSRLAPLTRLRCKPAVSFGGRFRIIDFALSNLLNSDITAIYVLAQYLSQSLIEHLRHSWRRQGIRREVFITVVPPQMQWSGSMRYRGTADAVFQNLNLVRQHRPSLVAVFGSDHVYRMDVRQMIAWHRAHGAGVTLGAVTVPRDAARELGCLDVDAEGRVLACLEKPAHPPEAPDEPERTYVSMGVYLIDPDLLEDTLRRGLPDLADDGLWSLSPELFPPGTVRAYDLRLNRVPGVRATEEPAYWRDVGTLPAWWQAHMDLLGRTPRFDIDNSSWPLLAEGGLGTSVRILSGQVEDSLLTEGVSIDGAVLRRSVLGHNVVLHPGADVEESIVMDGVVVGAGVRLRRAIVDSPNCLPPGLVVDRDEAPTLDGHFRDPSGLIVIPSGTHLPERRGHPA